jgi:TldD protein
MLGASTKKGTSKEKMKQAILVMHAMEPATVLMEDYCSTETCGFLKKGHKSISQKQSRNGSRKGGTYLFAILDYCVEFAEKLGADSVSVRLDDLTQTEIECEGYRIINAVTKRNKGLGITTHFQSGTGYSFTADLSKRNLRKVVKNSLKIAQAASKECLSVRNIGKSDWKTKPIPNVRKHPAEFPLEYKKELLDDVVSAAFESTKCISSVRACYGELHGVKYFLNNEGRGISWHPLLLEIGANVVLKENGVLTNMNHEISGTFGLEEFDRKEKSPETLGRDCVRWALEKFRAKSASSGKKRVLCGSRLTGALVHESFGHLCEADGILAGLSPLVGKIGEQVGPEFVTVTDEGICHGGSLGYWLPYDDEGSKTRRINLIDSGRLSNFLHSRETANVMSTDTTGNARAVNYHFPPIVRMRNTYLNPGDLRSDEAMEELDDGIYADGLVGGQASMDGTFMFKPSRTYCVKNGNVKYPLKEIIISGNIFSLLEKAEGATRKVEVTSSYFGGCVKDEQRFLPVGYGGPDLLISEIFVGGTR